MPATVEPRLWGKPAARHEAACASGSVAVLAATAEIEAGRYDCVLVLAVEQERNVPGADAPKHLGAAAWIGHEGQDATFMWPYMFSQLADEYDRRYGLNDAHLHAIAELNMRNAKANPLAQTRGWTHRPGGFADDDHDNPVVEGRLRRTDCAQVTDGVAGVLLVSDRFQGRTARWKTSRPHRRWGHGTAALALQPKLDRSQGQPYVFPHVRQVVTDAFRRAEIPGVGAGRHRDPRLLLHVGVHGHRPLRHYRTRRELEGGRERRAGAGRRHPGQPQRRPDRRRPPVGATGVRMLHDAARQVTGQAGDCQVEGARTFATLNIGGSLTTTVSFVVTAEK